MIHLLLVSFAGAAPSEGAPTDGVSKIVSPDTAVFWYFGGGVDGAGDVDGDGYDDAVIGAWGAAGWTGAAWLLYGDADRQMAAGQVRLRASDGAMGAYFGAPVAGAGDLNGDGLADVAIAATGVDDAAGAVYLFPGPDVAFDAQVRLDPDPASAAGYFGHGLAGVGDVDGDGLDDLAVGWPRGEGGVLWLYPGGDALDALAAVELLDPDGFTGDALGTSVSGGDVNGDGYADLVAGGPEAPAAVIWFGGAGDLIASQRITSPATHSFSRYGLSVSAGGDLDGDGYADLAVGAPDEPTLGRDAGAVYVYPGASGGVDLDAEVTFAVGDTDHTFGESVAIVGDTNGDGLDELLVGARGAIDNGGSAWLFFGGLDGADPDAPHQRAPRDLRDNEYFGDAVAGAGDLDGDGAGDLLIGAPNDGARAYDGGAAYIAWGVRDLDLDGVAADVDCDDADPTIDDTRYTTHPDEDGDGYGDPAVALQACDGIPGFTRDATDCDDADPDTHPGAAEHESATVCMRDADGDGWGDEETAGDVAPGSDCDDSDGAAHPGADEPRGDEIDSDCDGDEYCYADQDGDGWSDGRAVWSPDLLCDAVGEATADRLGDCDDTDPDARPGATDPCGDGVDSDCDGAGGPSGDEDGDGLTWSQEDRLGTDDCELDSDDDGLGDGAEYALGTDPARADTDGDGLLDGEDDDPLTPAGCGCAAASGAVGVWVWLGWLALWSRSRSRSA